MFDHISKRPEVRQKYSAASIINSLLGVWKCGEIRSLVFDIILLHILASRARTIAVPRLPSTCVPILLNHSLWCFFSIDPVFSFRLASTPSPGIQIITIFFYRGIDFFLNDFQFFSPLRLELQEFAVLVEPFPQTKRLKLKVVITLKPKNLHDVLPT